MNSVEGKKLEANFNEMVLLLDQLGKFQFKNLKEISGSK